MMKRGLIPVVFVAVIALAVALATFGFTQVPQSDEGESLNLKYKGFVCVYKNGELVSCDHNLLYDVGKNLTRDSLGVGGFGAILNISLCNATAGCQGPVAGASETFNTYVGCGLQSATGTYATLTATPGNWTVTKTFTATTDNCVTNVTRLTNATGTPFAGNSFTSVTLQTNDQLTINWTLMVS